MPQPTYLRRIRLRAAAILSVACSAPLFAAPIVTISTTPDANYSVAVGQTLTIPIFATVTDSATQTPPSGIGTYDFSALLADATGLQVVSYQLDGNLTLGNQSFTTIDPNGNALNLNAGFDPPGSGSNAPVKLFTVTVQGIAPGANGIFVSSDITPQGAPIVLYDDSEPAVNAPEISVQVTPAPEPASLALMALGIPLLLRRRRY